MISVHNGTCTMHCNLSEDIRIAKSAGYDGIEIIGSKLYRFLEQGYTLDHVRKELDGFPVIALGFVPDIERQQPDEFRALLQEADRMFEVATELGAHYVQVLSGPIWPGVAETGEYQGLIGSPWEDVLSLTAKNLKELARRAAVHELKLYLEPLAWAPLHSLDQSLQLIEAVDSDNVGMVIDFWHLWVNGATAADIARLSRDVIYGVHVCDSRPRPPAGEPILHDLREVWTGGGYVPIQAWIDAIVATGYDEWWSCELFAPQYWERNPHDVARILREHVQMMVDAALSRPS